MDGDEPMSLTGIGRVLGIRSSDLSNSGGNAFNDLGNQTSSSNEFHVEDLCYEPKLDYKISAILDMLQALERINDFKNGSAPSE